MTDPSRDSDPAFNPHAQAGDLRTEDAAALDALITASFDSTNAVRTLPNGQQRIEHLQNLLSLLDCDSQSDRSLGDVTFARLMQVRGERLGAMPSEVALSPDDDAALERLVMASFDSSRVPSALRERARRHQRLMELATASPVAADTSLTQRTLARVQAHIDAQAGTMKIEPRRPRGFTFRIADLVSVAAVLLIGAGVILPVLTAMRDQSRKSMCFANLGTTAGAMATYASSNRDALPVANASLGGGTWWNVSKPNSNSANLFTLTKAGYVPVEALACPGNPHACMSIGKDATDWNCLDEVSYSYQIMFGPQRPEWRKGDAVILADRSPIIPQAIRGQQLDPLANAPNHKGAGQHLLRNDGSITWTTSPVLKNGDNIWLPRNLEVAFNKLPGNKRRVDSLRLQGTETPEAADDTFLGP